jgi:hypothetical protein
MGNELEGEDRELSSLSVLGVKSTGITKQNPNQESRSKKSASLLYSATYGLGNI